MDEKTKTALITEEELLRAEIASDFLHNYFVSAGAGAGKTSLVVNRIVNQLASGQYKPENIAAITFTNKAAQELCERIAAGLRAYCANPSNSHLAEANDALLNIGRMQISTIHSFCHRLLKENCFASRLRLDFELLEDEDTAKMQEDFFEIWFNKNAAGFTNIQKEKPDNIFISYTDVLNNFRDICELPDGTAFSIADFTKVCRAEIAKAESNRDALISDFVIKYKSVINTELSGPNAKGAPFEGLSFSYTDIDRYLYAGCVSTVSDEEFYACVTDSQKGGCFKKNVSKSVKDQIAVIEENALNATTAEKQAVTSSTETIGAMKKTLVNTLILNFVLSARDEYRKQTFNRKITNDRLLQITDKLLDNPEVVEKIRRTFKCIYVDEFQDVDPIQQSLVLKLGMKESEFIPGMLFLVGDVKQSIYRFRGADYRLFNKTRDLFLQHPATCRVEELNINNRSNQNLIDYYNTKVSALANLIPGYINMVPRVGLRCGNDSLYGVYKAINNTCDLVEPDIIAAIVKHLVGKTDIIALEDDGTGHKKEVKRKIRYSDFLILTSNAVGNGKYVNTLQNYGVPSRISEEFVPSEMVPLKRFALIYRYLSLPYYERTKEALLEIALDDTNSDFATYTATLDAFREKCKGLSGAEIAGKLLECSELYLYSTNAIAGCKVKRYQMAVRQMVDTILSKNDNNPLVIAEEMKKYINTAEFSCEREIGFDQEEDAVRLMNIHKAKGLEGNIVIIGQRKKTDDRDATYTEDSSGNRYQVVNTFNGQSKKIHAPYGIDSIFPGIKDAADRERDMESARLEYVAVTRAREALVFLAPQDKETPMFYNYLDEDLPELFDKFPMTDEEKEDIFSAESGIVGDIEHAAEPSTTVISRTGYRVSPSNLEQKGIPVFPSENIASETKDEDDSSAENEVSTEEDPIPDDASESSAILQKRPSGDIFGTVMHRAFELAVKAMRKQKTREINTGLCIHIAINENNDDIEARYKDNASKQKVAYKEYLEKCFPAFIDLFFDKVVSAGEVLTEYPFSLAVTGAELVDIKSRLNLKGKISELLPPDGSENDNSVWVNGKADLILRNGDHTEIWDYKSDKTGEMTAEEFAAEIHRKYDNQMNLYKWVFRKLFGGEVNGKFFSIENGEIG